MLTDSLAIQQSHLGTGAVIVEDVTSHNLIEALHGLLPTLGWTVLDSYPATSALEFPLGYPGYPGPDIFPKQVCGVRPAMLNFSSMSGYGKVGFGFYNAHTEVPSAPYYSLSDGTMLWMVPWGDTGDESLDNLALMVSLHTAFNAEVDRKSSPITMTFTSRIPPATLYNGILIAGEGRYGIGGTGGAGSLGGVATGGGYLFRSAPESSQYTAKIVGSWGANGDSVTLEFQFFPPHNPNLLPCKAAYGLDTGTVGGGFSGGAPVVGRYAVFANGYQVAIFEPGVVDQFDYTARSILVAAPYIDTVNGFQAAYAAFAVSKVFHRMEWVGTVCLDWPPVFVDNWGPYPRMLAPRSAGPTLLPPTGQPLITNAWLQMGNAGDPATVVGQLWDCAVVGGVVDSIDIDGYHYMAIGQSDGTGGSTAATLVMCVGQQSGNPAPPAPGTSGDLAVSPTSVLVTLDQSLSASESLKLTNSTASSVTAGITADAAWISVSGGGVVVNVDGTATVPFGIDASAMSASGPLTGHITVRATVNGKPVVLTVAVQVSRPVAPLSASPSTVGVTAAAGTGASMYVTITNAGAQQVGAGLVTSKSWLLASWASNHSSATAIPAHGAATIALIGSAADLTPGTYTATVTVQYLGRVLTIPVTLAVTP